MNIDYSALVIQLGGNTTQNAGNVLHILNNIDYKTLLGDYYELGAKYNLIFKSGMVDPATNGVVNTQNCEMRVSSNCFNFHQYEQSGGATRKVNYGSFPKTNLTSALDIELESNYTYARNRTATFQLVGAVGDLTIGFVDVINNFINPAATTIQAQTLIFDIVKIPNDDTKIKYFPMYANLDLNWFDAQTGAFPTPAVANNNPIWYNVDLQTALGNIFELYGKYNCAIVALMNTRNNLTSTARRDAPQIDFSNMKATNVRNNKLLPYIQTFRNSFGVANFPGLITFSEVTNNYTLLMEGASNTININMRLVTDTTVAVANSFYILKLRFSKLRA